MKDFRQRLNECKDDTEAIMFLDTQMQYPQNVAQNRRVLDWKDAHILLDELLLARCELEGLKAELEQSWEE